MVLRDNPRMGALSKELILSNGERLKFPFCLKCQKDVESFYISGWRKESFVVDKITIRCHGETWTMGGNFNPPNDAP